ncbi:MAG TPA: PRC-barrel domain-containing protein [Anaerolineales bacterium]
MKEGADVVSADGEKVGDVSRVIVDPDTDRITHFLISEGLFFKEKKLIPVHWVSEVVENEVRLSVDAALLERVPEFRE